jgi:8-oxo-dGTP diphosphatase
MALAIQNRGSSKNHKVVNVVCLVAIDRDTQILATQRAEDKPLGLLWEFPGGKIDKGESAEEALRREIHEELGIELGTLTHLPAVTHTYDFGTIQLIPFLSEVDAPLQLGKLHVHAAARWIALQEWEQLQWAPADVPIIEGLLKSDLSK